MPWVKAVVSMFWEKEKARKGSREHRSLRSSARPSSYEENSYLGDSFRSTQQVVTFAPSVTVAGSVCHSQQSHTEPQAERRGEMRWGHIQ